MEKSPYCVKSEAFKEVKKLRRYDERFPYGMKDEDMVPRITGEAAQELVAILKALDRFRAKSWEMSVSKVIRSYNPGL
jgi:hypothetical protein